MDCAFPLNSLNLYQKDFYGFYLLFKAGLHFSIHNNKLQCSSFFCTTNKFWDFVVQKNFFWVRTQPWTPPPPGTQSYAFGLTPPLPHLRRTHYVEDPNECFAKISQQVSVLECWSLFGVSVLESVLSLFW